MYYSELIHDFLEGTLDKGQQDIFFIALTNNEDFRQELIESIKIDRSFSARLSQMAPSAASTYTVFSKLGFNPPSSIPIPNKIPFYRKYAQGIMASIVSILVTSFVFGFIINNNKDIPSGNSLKAVQSAGFPLMSSFEGAQHTIAANDKENVTSVRIPDTKNTTNNINYGLLNYNSPLPISVTDLETNQNKTITQRFEGITESEIATNDLLGQFDNSRISEEDINLIKKLPDFEDIGVSQYKGWGLELKGSYYMSVGKVINGIEQAKEFQNFGIGLTYQAADNMKLLLRVSNLNFDRTNETITPDRYIKTKSESSYLNIAAGVRYYFLNFENASFFAQSSIGIFHDFTGGTGSMQIGLEYAVTPDYSIIVNGEVMVLGIEQDKKPHLIPKTGINFGMGLNL